MMNKGQSSLKALERETEIQVIRDKLAVSLAALEEIKRYKGMTNLGACCVDHSCSEYQDVSGNKLSHCSFQFGVSRGFDTCAQEAEEALAKIGGA